MRLNQTDVAVDVELEKVIITIYSNTETSRAPSTPPEKLQEPPVKQRRVYSLDSNAYCSSCWNLAEITLFLMKFDEI